MSRLLRHVATRRLAGVLLASGLAVAHAADAPAAWSAAAALGQGLYYGTRSFSQAPQVAGAAMPMSDSACVRCHGALGEGGRESNLAAPALVARGGTAAAGDANARRGTTHAPTPQPAWADALTQGVGSEGRALSQVMPRYALTAAERNALLAFMPWLGRADTPVRGVGATELRLGLALDGISGSAAREQVEAGLRSVLQQVNENGGVHGRQLRLLPVVDADADVMALVGSAPGAVLRERLAAERLPNLASLALEPDDARPTDWTVPLLPSLRQQARAALQALAGAPAGCLPWLIDPSGWLSAAESAAVVRWPARPSPGVRNVCVAALAPAAEVDRLRADWTAQGLALRMLVELAWLRPRPIEQAGLDHRLVLPAPQAVAEEAAAQGHSLWFELGTAAARVAVEALARSGRVLQPELVIAQLRGLAGFEPVAQAPLAFSRQQTHGWAPQHWRAAPNLTLQARGGTP